MRWEDESYVKLYTRDTPMWRALCWQAKALLPLVLRVLDKAGLLECGQLGRGAIALMTGLPEEVASVGLADLERVGTLVWHESTCILEMPNFEAAQEARKSDLQRKRDERQRAKDKARLQVGGKTQGVSHDVTRRPQLSHDVTLQTPQTPQTPQTEILAGSSPAEKAGEPGWKELVAELYLAFKAKRGCEPRPRPKDWKALALLRQRTKSADGEIFARWQRGLSEQFKQRVDSFWDLNERWDALTGNSVATGPPRGRDIRRDPVRAEDVDWSNVIPGVQQI